jgi:hypothetical protein
MTILPCSTLSRMARLFEPRRQNLKLPAHRAGLPGKVILLYIVPLDPAYKAGLTGHVPVESLSHAI